MLCVPITPVMGSRRQVDPRGWLASQFNWWSLGLMRDGLRKQDWVQFRETAYMEFGPPHTFTGRCIPSLSLATYWIWGGGITEYLQGSGNHLSGSQQRLWNITLNRLWETCIFVCVFVWFVFLSKVDRQRPVFSEPLRSSLLWLASHVRW